MSRFIRLYEKKRGDRRTGSKAFGNLGEALFFGFFFVIGCAAFAFMFWMLLWPEWRANRQFAETTATIEDRTLGVGAASGDSGPTYRPEFRIRYTIDGKTYTQDKVYAVTGIYSDDKQIAQATVDSFQVGQEYPCWYDPINPERVVLVRGYSGWLYLFLLIPLSFIVIGAGGLIYTLLRWNTSAERQAVLTQRAAKLDLFDLDRANREYPTVPADVNVTNSPGTTLAYRLPMVASTGWTLFAVALACVFWNGIIAIFVTMAIRSIARGEPDWFLVVFVTPFVAIGVSLVVYFVREVLVHTGVGPTRLEISAHPLAPGECYDAYLSQAGRLTMNSLEVWLACEEKATYRQGTDTRTETRQVYLERCFVREGFEIHQGLPFESRCQVRVPEQAMHSFRADHNEVRWKLVVKGSVAGWPDYSREFQIVVNPNDGHDQA